MSSLTEDFADLVGGVRRPGGFSAGGLCDLLAPRLEVEGVGAVSLPLLPVQAEALIAVAKRAPFGRGDRTVVDTDVRRTWQIGPDRVRIEGQGWSRTLAEIVRRAADGLGVTDPVTAEFYKLLVYDDGSFFVGHRDTEKAPGMFATLVVVLPSTSAGGELVVRHEGRESRYDMRCPDPSQAAFATFYADCLHEVLPVTAGHRLTLVYNLLRAPAAAMPKAPDYTGERAGLAALLRGWAEDETAPAKLVHPLEHAYTPAGLCFAELKGADAAKAATLLGATQDADCELHLALLSIEETGSADHTGGYRSWRDRGDDEDEDEFEVAEVHDRSEILSDWCRPDGGPAGLGPLPLEDGEVSPPDALDDMAPDDESFREATGNEGASFERSYSRAALVAWPRRRRVEVVNQGGLPATLPALSEMADRWAAEGGDRGSPLWAEAHELAGHMVATWPRGRGWAAPPSPEIGSFLAALGRLGDVERVDAALADIVAAGLYAKGQAGDVLAALRLLPKGRAALLCEAIVAGNASGSFADAAEFLVEASTAFAAGDVDLRPAAHALLAAMPGDPARRSEDLPWRRPHAPEPGTVVDLIMGLDRVDAASALAAAQTMLAWPATYDLDDVLVPASLKLGRIGGPAADRLRGAALDHLDARIAVPLAPPGDWSRDGTLRCACPHCADLGRFLVDPARQSWSLKAVQHERSHVESTILTANSDLDCTTLRAGRPQTLVCTKNQASYGRRARQREGDLAARARLARDAAPR